MTSSTSERTVITLNKTWVGRSGVSKIDIHRRDEYGWVLWIFVAQRPVPMAAMDTLAQIAYDAKQQFPFLQHVQLNEYTLQPISDVIRCAALLAIQ